MFNCPVGEYLDTSKCYSCETCVCVPDPNYSTSVCKKPKSCPVLMSWSIQECRCICSGNLSCQIGYVIDENLCKCVLEPIPSCAKDLVTAMKNVHASVRIFQHAH